VTQSFPEARVRQWAPVDHPTEAAEYAALEAAEWTEQREQWAETWRSKGEGTHQELDQTVISQCTARLPGGFPDDRDLDKLRKAVGYPVEIHNPQVDRVPGLPDELEVDGESIPVRRFEDDGGNTTGSEWIYSDDTGRRERRDTSSLSMEAPHVGAHGKGLKPPDY
jgi:hypothetical protein